MPGELPERPIQPASGLTGVSAAGDGGAPAPVTGLVTLPGGPSSGVPWTGMSLLLVWLLGELCLLAASGVLQGAFVLRYGPEWQQLLGPSPSTWLILWANLLALPVRLAAAILTLRALSQARLVDMGLTSDRLLRNVLIGLALALPLALVVYGVQYGCEVTLRRLGADIVQEHPFSKLAHAGLTPWQWGVLIAAALVAAPLWEEFLFRGLIQPWAIDRPQAPAVLMALAVCLAVVFRLERIQAAWSVGGRNLSLELLPVLAALGLMPVFLILKGAFRSPVPAALFASAVLFGWFHVAVWPSPVALTLLALGLGWLRHRSGSLAGPIALHATFNAIAVVALLIEPWLPGLP